MNLYCLNDCHFDNKNNILAIGFFDGVHLGHQKIIRFCIKRAKEMNAKSIILTFDNPPINILTNKLYKKLIMPFDKKVEIICNMGIDCIVSAKFDSAFAKISPLDFCENILVKKLNVKEVIVGEDFRFGENASGDGVFLKEYFEPLGVKIHMIPILKKNGDVISSTLIRKFFKDGDIERIYFFMGRYPEVEGNVISGKQKGREIGFPTANLDMDKSLIYPRDGVYLGEIQIEDTKEWKPSLINIGHKPTFFHDKKNIEVYILDFKGNIYAQKVKVRFLKRIRDEKFFDSESSLKKEIKKDLDKANEYFKIK
jgi:riboflavin kinase / FMN adenylyltransferase